MIVEFQFFFGKGVYTFQQDLADYYKYGKNLLISHLNI